MIRLITATLLLLALSAESFAQAAPAKTVKPAIVRSVAAGNAALLKLGDLTKGSYLIEITDAGITLSGPYTILEIGPTPIPPGPQPPPVSDLRAKLAAEVAKITATDKASTAATLNQALTATIPTVKSGQVSKDNVTMVLGLLGPTMPAWSAFISVLNDAVKATTTATALADVLQVAVDELGKVK